MTHRPTRGRAPLVVALTLCAAPLPARAQESPNYGAPGAVPSTGDSPAPVRTQGGGTWLPGQPLPVMGQGSRNNPTNATGGLAEPEGGVPAGSARGTGEARVRPEDLQSMGVSVDDPHAGDPSRLPDTHRVVKGDTLWDLSGAYFRNNWYWPKLWAMNPAITNPHWIYPGDLLRLRPPGGPAPTLPGAPPPSPMMRISKDGLVDTGIHLRHTGFVEPGELKVSGRISSSREEQLMLTVLDEAYVEWSEEEKPKEGERLTVYRLEREVKSPDGDVIGNVVEVVGEVELRGMVNKKMARAVIVEALAPIERGFRVGPLRRRFDLVEPVAASEDVDARVVAALRPSELMGESMVLFIDRGREEGLKLGNRLQVVRRGDGYQPRMRFRPEDDKRFPRELLGEILLVDVRGHTATAVVMKSIREVEVGDHLEARKGY